MLLGHIALLAVTLSLVSGANAQELDPAQLYVEYCSVCHGDQGDGRSRAAGSLAKPPRDFTSAEASILTRDQLVHAISNGIPGTAMSPWKEQLSPEQIGALADYLRDTFMRSAIVEDTTAGQRIYAEFCSVCHGEQGDGKSRAAGSLLPSPRDFTSAEARNELTRTRMIFSVTYGRANTAMANWGEQLSKEEIEATVDYIRRSYMNISQADEARLAEAAAAAEAASVEMMTEHDHSMHGEVGMEAPFPAHLIGDPVWGKDFYVKNCAHCHGEKGDGQGPRAYFITPKPRDFSHPAARASLNREMLFDSIALGKTRSEMPAWIHVLTRQEIANVAEYVFQAFIYPEELRAMAEGNAEAEAVDGQSLQQPSLTPTAGN